MKTKIITLLYLFLTLPLLVSAGTIPSKGKYTKEKKIIKEYNVNADAQLLIDNSYGNVNMVSWNENRIVIEVLVKTTGNEEEEVQQKLKDIDVRFEGSASLVSAKTIFKSRESRSWWNSWKNNNVHMEINYTIKLPITNRIDVSNDYGGVVIDKLEGTAKISCDYGKLTLGELLGENNYLSFDYTKSSSIDFMKSGRINADYSSFILDGGGNIELNADYTKSEFGNIGDLDYNCDYGSILTRESNNITGKGDYISAKIGIVHGNLNIKADYGSIRIDELASDAGDIEIQSDYTGIKVGYNPLYNFNFIIRLEYAGLTGKEDLVINKERKDSSDKLYEGYYGTRNSKNTVNIISEYGGVTLSKN